MESICAPVDPTEALRRYATSGGRSEAIRSVLAQPYLDGVEESMRLRLAESLVGLDDESGKNMLKQLPLNRAHRRALLASERWVVHLCSGADKGDNPLKTWCEARDMQLLEVDLLAKGGKGWDLTKTSGVWRALLWAAATGRVVSLFSSPNPRLSESTSQLGLQPLFLWSLASVAKGRGIPFVFEVPQNLKSVYESFSGWANASLLYIDQGVVDPYYSRSTCICTNVNLSHLQTMPLLRRSGRLRTGSHWSSEFRTALVGALEGRYVGPSCEELDKVIASALRSGSKADTSGGGEVVDIDGPHGEEQLTEPGECVQPEPEATPAASPKRQFTQREVEAWKRFVGLA